MAPNVKVEEEPVVAPASVTDMGAESLAVDATTEHHKSPFREAENAKSVAAAVTEREYWDQKIIPSSVKFEPTSFSYHAYLS